MFKRRRYKIKFQKKCFSVTPISWEEVNDNSLISVLVELQKIYEFEIISYKLEDCFHTSSITIKCNKEDKNKIFCKYCSLLDMYIHKISY